MNSSYKTFILCAFLLLASCAPSPEPPAVSGVIAEPAPTPSIVPKPTPTPTPTPEPSATPEPTPEAAPAFAYELPGGFVYIRDIDPEIAVDLKYAGQGNFTGGEVDGYLSGGAAILTAQAAEALSLVRQDLAELGYGLIVYDAYRPQKAVECFVMWSQNGDAETKDEYYPNEDKEKLFNQGYIARRSAHSRGSTVDLSLIRLSDGAELDMGGHFDLLDPVSSHGSTQITGEQAENRNILKSAMVKRGFNPYSKEWWHYTLKDEPFPDEYFDFDVK